MSLSVKSDSAGVRITLINNNAVTVWVTVNDVGTKQRREVEWVVGFEDSAAPNGKFSM